MQPIDNGKTLLATFPVFISYSFSNKAQQELLKSINLHYLGDEDCDRLDSEGKLEPKYPDKETEEFRHCQWSAQRGNQRYVMLNFYSDGSSEITGEANFKDKKEYREMTKKWI